MVQVSMSNRYRYKKGSVTSIRYHVIWRRRRNMLVGELAKRLIIMLREKAGEIDVKIMHLAVCSKHWLISRELSLISLRREPGIHALRATMTHGSRFASRNE